MRRLLSALATMACIILSVPAAAEAATLTATPSTFARVFAGAQPGDTILLASGDYGTFTGALKSGEVIVREQDGASATMAVDFRPASHITIDGLNITSGYMSDSRTKNITIRNSTFDGPRSRMVFRAESGKLVNANILLDRNTHSNANVCSGCWDGRVHVSGRTEEPTGINIQNSLFYGGDADGIQNGGHSVRIIGNTFRDICQGCTISGAHTDSIQLYGSKGTLIRGNFFYNVDMGNPGAYDRLDHEVIEDNVVVSANYPFQTQLLSDNGSIVRHNTFVEKAVDGSGCDYSLPCGIVRMGNKSADPRSAGTVFKDNILAQLSITGTSPDFAENDYNLYTDVKGAGANSLLADPVFAGGASPTTYEGFKLAAGSPGKAAASDGLDMGARFSSDPAPEPEPAPPPAETAMSFEAEGMKITPWFSVYPEPGVVQDDVTASAGKRLLMRYYGTASQSINTTSDANRLTIRARGNQCAGAPQMTVKVDGATVGSRAVLATSWTDYTLELAAPKGSHTVEISYDNDYEDASCNRNLYLDKATFAYAPPPTSFEAETMTVSQDYSWSDPNPGRVQDDPTASAGKRLMLWTYGTAFKDLTAQHEYRKIVVRAKGDQCSGAPEAWVKVDGTVVAKHVVSSTSWTDYTIAATVPAGARRITVQYPYDYESAGCNRNLHLDKITLDDGS